MAHLKKFSMPIVPHPIRLKMPPPVGRAYTIEPHSFIRDILTITLLARGRRFLIGVGVI